MDGELYNLTAGARFEPLCVRQRRERIRRLILLGWILGFAYLVAATGSHTLPTPLQVWDDVMTVAQHIAQLPA